MNGLVPNPFYGVITDPKSKLSAPTVTLNTLLRPFPQYSGGVSGSTPNIGNSIYHGVQIQYEKRFSQGLAVLAHYTFSKLIDDSSFSSGNVGWLGGVTDVQDPFNSAPGAGSVGHGHHAAAGNDSLLSASFRPRQDRSAAAGVSLSIRCWAAGK